MDKKYRLGYGGLTIFTMVAPWLIVLIWGLFIFFARGSYIFPAILTFSLPVPIIALVVFGVLLWANSRWFVMIEPERIILQELIEKHEIQFKEILKLTIIDGSYYLKTVKIVDPRKRVFLYREYGNRLIESFKEKDNIQAINATTKFVERYYRKLLKLSQGKFFLVSTPSKAFVVSPKDHDLFLAELKEKYKISQKKNLMTSKMTLRY